jgi:hypothetical protein
MLAKPHLLLKLLIITTIAFPSPLSASQLDKAMRKWTCAAVLACMVGGAKLSYEMSKVSSVPLLANTPAPSASEQVTAFGEIKTATVVMDSRESIPE